MQQEGESENSTEREFAFFPLLLSDSAAGDMTVPCDCPQCPQERENVITGVMSYEPELRADMGGSSLDA